MEKQQERFAGVHWISHHCIYNLPYMLGSLPLACACRLNRDVDTLYHVGPGGYVCYPGVADHLVYERYGFYCCFF